MQSRLKLVVESEEKVFFQVLRVIHVGNWVRFQQELHSCRKEDITLIEYKVRGPEKLFFSIHL